ncbi:FAD-dependent monooxygenase terC [Colletotrichum spinosum]|uniref:FAD-dependent monooxygenase terC n=1 Tax=Colletotrichum spinosum TaxID=1347390 RepID=A0A4R8Q6X7_9PEZI|nr:FAD-dependent monooxygenase terC [Colletotrichum spinosum]
MGLGLTAGARAGGVRAKQVYYDFERFGYTDSNFILDPDNWFMAAKITKQGLWRVTYGEVDGLTRDEMVARQPDRFRTMLPGRPQPHEYTLAEKGISPYRVHQRCAERMRVGRFLLAADAAHLCNPFGGLGLTGGIVDVGGLHECLSGIFRNRADESILDTYDDVRRQKYRDVVDPSSCAMFRRMFAVHPDRALDEDGFLILRLCVEAESDRDKLTEMTMGAQALGYDITKHYHALEADDDDGANTRGCFE